jgi:hypothetical protein
MAAIELSVTRINRGSLAGDAIRPAKTLEIVHRLFIDHFPRTVGDCPPLDNPLRAVPAAIQTHNSSKTVRGNILTW